jgi:hypothetical protein
MLMLPAVLAEKWNSIGTSRTNQPKRATRSRARIAPSEEDHNEEQMSLPAQAAAGPGNPFPGGGAFVHRVAEHPDRRLRGFRFLSCWHEPPGFRGVDRDNDQNGDACHHGQGERETP